ncbi:MAG: 3-dehydroquinate synthase [Bacteroidales bacterium]|nr:3-dehydroquinate synthase [Bacteroidales bacterium]
MKKQAYIVYDIAVEEFARKLAADWKKDGYCEVKDMMAIVASEEDKSLAAVQAICSWLLANGAEKGATLVAVGGGVTSDVVGLAGAIYKRGMPVEYVPTTLLAQVDAAIGGKTGVNLDGVKNAVGLISLPQKVHILPEPLKTLGPREWKSGSAELIKTFALFDSELYDKAIRLFSLVNGAGYTQEAVDAAIPEIIELAKAAARLKEKAVKKDLFDRDKRHLLNLGHTYGHAIEWWQSAGVSITKGNEITIANFSHGEAVAIGMVAAARLSEIEDIAEPGLATRLAKDLESCGLPTQLPASAEELFPAINNDKKIEGDKLDFVFLKDIGKPVLKKRRIKDLILQR